MRRNQLREISRQAVNIPKFDDTSLSWHNSALSVRTAKSLHIFEFSYNFNCMDKKLDFIESVISVPKSSPATYLVSNNFISYGVSNFELSQLIIDPSLWPHSPQIVQEMVCTIDCKWSPYDFYYNGEPLIALLNNIGNVNIFGKKSGKWVHLLDLSACVKKELNLELPVSVQDLKIKADVIESSALCFSPKSSNNESCSIILGQKNGSLLFWTLNDDKNNKLKASYQGCINTDSNEVKSILWINKCKDKLLFVVSNILGQIILYDCKLRTKVEVVKMHMTWPHQDKMITQYLNYTRINNKLILLFDKHRHFVVQMLDDDYKVIAQYAEIVNDHKISKILVHPNCFYLATLNFQLYKINIDLVSGNLEVKLDLIEIKDTWNNYELFDLSVSRNNVIVTLAVINRSVNVRKEAVQIDVLFFSNENSDFNMEFSLYNEMKHIINIWDAVELLRYKILKTKTLPITELKQLITEGNSDVYKLKLYIIIANVWLMLENNLKVQPGLLPEDVNKVRENVLLKHAQLQLNEMHKLIIQNKISSFEKESFIATKKYMQYYSNKYKVKLENLISPAVFNSVNDEKKYICQCCDNEIEGFLCRDKHMNMFCPLSFMPIETNDYLICPLCKITARFELYVRKAKCIFCESYLQKYL